MGNAVNGFSQRHFWLLVLLNQGGMSRLTRGMMEYLIVSIIKPQVFQLSRA